MALNHTLPPTALAKFGEFIPSSLPKFSAAQIFIILPRLSQGISFGRALPLSSPQHTPFLSLFSLAFQNHMTPLHQRIGKRHEHRDHLTTARIPGDKRSVVDTQAISNKGRCDGHARSRLLLKRCLAHKSHFPTKSRHEFTITLSLCLSGILPLQQTGSAHEVD